MFQRVRRLTHVPRGRAPHDVLRGGEMRPRGRLWSEREGEPRRVDDAVRPDEGDGHLRGLSHVLPAPLDLGDVGHHAQHGLLTAVHGLRLDLAEPHLQVGGEVFAGQLKHGHVAAAVQLQDKKRKPWRNVLILENDETKLCSLKAKMEVGPADRDRYDLVLAINIWRGRSWKFGDR